MFYNQDDLKIITFWIPPDEMGKCGRKNFHTPLPQTT
jgi:hypothetical protein